jgi:hypothetical protein
MKQHGSVLVVVLGLLAILAVIGVAFLTLSSLERSTATSFALQTQMMIAADGALDYAVHQMVTDVWEWNIPEANKFEFTGRLLTGVTNTSGVTCEPYDYPSAADDPWLSTPIVSNATPAWISFGQMSATRFGIKFGSQVTGPDNLGFPVAAADRTANGIWIPDLAAPCDQYLIRASVTILDHNALVNLNAHGSKDTWDPDKLTGWQYGDCIGKGYFISDVQPGVDLTSLLLGIGTPDTPDWVPGCWYDDDDGKDDDKPGNSMAGAVLIENPSDPLTGATDIPYTLDEEFELRNLWGTYFKSRLEQIWLILDTNPGDYPIPSSKYEPRLKITTVSWTAEVRGDGRATDHIKVTGGDWSAAKVDLNTASADDIYQALLDGRAWEDGDELKQFVANLVTFRRNTTLNNNISNFTVGGTDCVGAVRQPVFSEATRTGGDPDKTDLNDIKRTYTIRVEVYNPWQGDYAGHTGGLRTLNMRVTFDVNPPPSGGVAHQVLKAGVANTTEKLSSPTAGNTCCSPIVERQVVCHNDLTLHDVLKSIRLHYGPDSNPQLWRDKVLNLDLITGNGDNTNIADLETKGRIYREVDFVDEPRGTRNDSPIRVFYVSDWNSGGTANVGTPPILTTSLRNSAIPIRFPNCVTDPPPTFLPVRAPAGTDFKAFARVGDLNQVLRFAPGGASNWWAEPWICTVTRTPRSQESNVKFDWMKNIDNLNVAGATAAAYAANVLSAGGPWNDGLDNDGDTQTDFADNGTGTGRPGGPEFRVAGKINLNTAIAETMTALGLASLPAKPIKSPAQILTGATMPTAGLEQRDLPFTRISNIATVRSDTFSVYGTVQIVDPTTQSSGVIPDTGIIRSRRFWALVDRSPALAYPPTDKTNFIYPRILNFQWLD